MHIDPMTLARARLALRQAAQGYLFDPNVSLIDFGNPEHAGQIAADELAIRIHVRTKLTGPALETAVARNLTRPIPPTIGGFPTDVPEGTYHPYLSSWGNGGWRPPRDPRAVRVDPLRGGISISDERHRTYGTLGCRVIDRASGAAMLLSNWHVLVADWFARPGQHIYQPGRLDGGMPADTVARLARDAMRRNLDAAVASLDGSRELVNDQLDLGPIRGVGAPELGMEVVKSGRRTNVTFGRVTAIEGTARIRYGPLDRVIRSIVTIEPLDTGQVSAPGDSGACWLDTPGHRAIGLHFAGSDVPERALALDIQAVLDALDVDIDTRREPASWVERRRGRFWTGSSSAVRAPGTAERRGRSAAEVRP